jgi:hypothetical protein
MDNKTFYTKVAFSLIISIFSIVMLSLGKDKTTYLSILLGVAAIWIPLPDAVMQIIGMKKEIKTN